MDDGGDDTDDTVLPEPVPVQIVATCTDDPPIPASSRPKRARPVGDDSPPNTRVSLVRRNAAAKTKGGPAKRGRADAEDCVGTDDDTERCPPKSRDGAPRSRTVAARTVADAGDVPKEKEGPGSGCPGQPRPFATRVLRRRDFVITSFADEMPTRAFDINSARIRYAVWQREACPDTGNLHWQIYMEFYEPVKPEFVKQLFGDPGLHVEIRKKPREFARFYCMKKRTRVEGTTYHEWGEWSTAGARTDIQRAQEAIDDGQTLATVAAEHPDVFVRYRNGIEAYRRIADQQNASGSRKVTVRIFYGATGTGKTRMALQEALQYTEGEMSGIFILDRSDGSQLWFDGYEGGPCLIVDDYDSWIPVTTLLRLLDRYMMRLAVKGSFTFAKWTEVWITTNRPIDEWTDVSGRPIDPEHRRALMRRISWIVQFMANGSRIIHRRPVEVEADPMGEEDLAPFTVAPKEPKVKQLRSPVKKKRSRSASEAVDGS